MTKSIPVSVPGTYQCCGSGSKTLEPTYIPIVRSHAAVDHANVVGDLFNLAGGLVLEQDRLVLLLSGQHHSIYSLDKRH